jgi:hypothetical protein
MPTFSVDEIELARGAKHFFSHHDALVGIASALSVLSQHASATGDPSCSQAYSGFTEQWRKELEATYALFLGFAANLMSAQIEYVDTDSAATGVAPLKIDWRAL